MSIPQPRPSIRQKIHDPRLFTPNEHVGYVRMENVELRRHIARIMEETGVMGKIKDAIKEAYAANTPDAEPMSLSGTGSVEVFTAGSDGREEKGVSSAFECMLLYDRPYWIHSYIDVAAIMNGCIGDGVIDRRTELKALGTGRVHCFRGEQGKYYPSRIIDAARVTGGDSDLLAKARVELCESMVRDGAKVLDGKRQMLKSHRYTIKTGTTESKGKSYVNFDVDAGVAYMDRENYCCSFKYGPLRFLQVWTTIQVIKAIRKVGDQSGVDILNKIPRQVTGKIDYLQSGKLLNLTPQMADQLKHLYEYFLWLYHISEYEYYVNNSQQATFRSDEVREALRTLTGLDVAMQKIQ